MKTQFFLSSIFLLSSAAQAQISDERFEQLSSSIRVRYEVVTVSSPVERVVVAGKAKQYFAESQENTVVQSASVFGNQLLNGLLKSDRELKIEKVTSAKVNLEQVADFNKQCAETQKEILMGSIEVLGTDDQVPKAAVTMLNKLGADLSITVSDRTQIASWTPSSDYQEYSHEVRALELAKAKAKSTRVMYYQSNAGGVSRLTKLVRPPSLTVLYPGKLNLRIQATVTVNPKTKDLECNVMTEQDLEVFWKMVERFDPEKPIATYFETLYQ